MSRTWDNRFLGLADQVAGWSKDPSTQVGCIIVNNRRQVVSTGFNGFPRGVDDAPARYADRPTKYLMVLHAEQNAVLQAGGDVHGGTAYVTHPPCAQCAATLIQAGIARIVTRRPDPGMAERFAESFKAASMMLWEAGVAVDYQEKDRPMPPKAQVLLERALDALNRAPRFKLPHGDSYGLAEDIADYLDQLKKDAT